MAEISYGMIPEGHLLTWLKATPRLIVSDERYGNNISPPKPPPIEIIKREKKKSLLAIQKNEARTKFLRTGSRVMNRWWKIFWRWPYLNQFRDDCSREMKNKRLTGIPWTIKIKHDPRKTARFIFILLRIQWKDGVIIVMAWYKKQLLFFIESFRHTNTYVFIYPYSIKVFY
jgi:hypothetical protein